MEVLSILKPHVFFDDQHSQLQSPADDLPMVYVPFGVANTESPLIFYTFSKVCFWSLSPTPSQFVHLHRACLGTSAFPWLHCK